MALVTRKQIEQQYRDILGRDPAEQEVNDWISWAQSNPEQGDASQFNTVFRSAAGNELKQSTTAKGYNIPAETIANIYRTELGREPEPGAVEAWQKWAVDNNKTLEDFTNSFKSSAQQEIKGTLTTEANKMIAGEIPGYDEATQKAAIESQYKTAEEDLANKLAEQAAGGGFETGAYYASIAKGKTGLESAKINTLADLNNAITQYKTQLKTQGLGLLSGIENQNYTRTQAAAEEATYQQQLAEYRAALKKQQENWWQAPLGALVGGVAGSWLGPGGLWAGATAGGAMGQKAAGTVPVAPTYTPTAGVSGYYGASTTPQVDYSYLWRK